MTVAFDAGSGSLRLDAESFIALAEHTSSPSPVMDETTRALVDAGVLVDGHAHPSLRAGLAAVANPLASLQVLVTGQGGAQLHQGWLSVLSAVLADIGDGTYDFVGLGTEFVPTAVARMTRLRFRPRLEHAVARVDESVLDDLSAGDEGVRRDGGASLAMALAPLPAISACVRDDDWQLSVVDVTFPSDGYTVARRLAWVDTEAGMVGIEADDHGPFMAPTSSTEVWRSIVALLPTDEELGLVPTPAGPADAHDRLRG